MSGSMKSDLLAKDIAAVLTPGSKGKTVARGLLLAGAAIACMQPLTADALGLGELQIQSSVGQPLRGTTTARIAGGESLSSGCITSTIPQSGMGGVQNLQVKVPATSSPGVHTIQVSSRKPLYEPMYEIRLQVNCPGGVNFARDYIVMLNLPMTSQSNRLSTAAKAPAPQRPSQPEVPSATPKAAPNTRKPAARPAATITVSAPLATPVAQPAATKKPRPYTERFPTPTAPITSGSEYRVQAGDTLSTIAQRIKGRPEGSTYAVAEQIFILNPEAFIANDPNKVKLGSVLRIPAAGNLLHAAPSIAATPSTLVNTLPEPTTAEVVEAPAQPVNEAAVSSAATQPSPQLVAETPVVSTRSETELADNVSVTAAPGVLPIARDMAADAVPAETTDETIVVDSSLIDDPALEAEPFAAERVAPAPAVLRPVETTQADNPAANKGFKVHPLLAAGLGALLGCILAALFFGRRILRALLPERSERNPVEVIEALNQASAEQPARDIDFQGVDTDVNEAAPGFIVDDNSNVNPAMDFKVGSAVTEAASTATSPADDLSATDSNSTDSNNAPRISLKDTGTHQQLDPATIENTEQFAAPDFSVDGEPLEKSELDGTNTMRKLFSEEAEQRAAEASSNDADFSITAELPELTDIDDQDDLDATADLQSIAETVDSATIDDKLSQTLTQALDLLEKDYEEEFTSSQILEQREINEAFGSLKKH